MTSHDLKDLELLRRYLLGELDAGEADTLEERLLREKKLFDLAEAIEGDLLAASTQGELSPTERGRVLRRLAASPGGRARLALARDLTRIARQSERAEGTVAPFPPKPDFDRSVFRIAAMAAGLAVVIGGLWLGRQTSVPGKDTTIATKTPVGVEATPSRIAPSSGQGTQTQPQPQDRIAAHDEDTPATPAEKGPAVTPLPPVTPPGQDQIAEQHTPLLNTVIQIASLSGTRGEGGPSEVYGIPAEAKKVEIRLPLSEEDQEKFSSFKVTLNDAERTILSTDAPFDLIENSLFVIVSVPASELQDGRYKIELQGVSPEGSARLIGAQQIEIRRHPGS